MWTRLTTYLLGIAAAVVPGCATQPAVRRQFDFEVDVAEPPERVFPLLCPIREREWIEGWQADVLYSQSGVAETDAVFRTEIRTGETWVTTRYDPPHAVSYTIFAGPHAVLELDITLEALPDGRSRWRTRRTYTGLSRLGRGEVSNLSPADLEAEHRRLAEQLDHFLATGTMLTSSTAPRPASVPPTAAPA